MVVCSVPKKQKGKTCQKLDEQMIRLDLFVWLDLWNFLKLWIKEWSMAGKNMDVPHQHLWKHNQWEYINIVCCEAILLESIWNSFEMFWSCFSLSSLPKLLSMFFIFFGRANNRLSLQPITQTRRFRTHLATGNQHVGITGGFITIHRNGIETLLNHLRQATLKPWNAEITLVMKLEIGCSLILWYSARCGGKRGFSPKNSTSWHFLFETPA